MSFRINAKHFALTYSNVEQQGWVEFTKEVLAEHLLSLGGEYVLVSKEMHADGSCHFHALVSYKRRKDVRNANFFDFNNVHPNVQSCRTVPAWSTYIKKDGDFIEQGVAKDDVFELCRQGTKEDWIAYCLGNRISYMYMDHIWDATHVPDVNTLEVYDKPAAANIHFELEYFRFDDFSARVLSIVGPTGCGKTTWAMMYAEKPALIVTHMDTLREFKPGYHKSLIFDDMSFLHMPRESQIQITDQRVPRTLHCRYKAITIPAGVQKIFTNNVKPFSEDEAINRRVYYKIIE